MSEIALYERRLVRATNARQQAEMLLEQKSLALYEEAQERESAVTALRESEERYRLLVQLSPEAILIATGGGIVFANPAAGRLFLNSEEDANLLLGHSIISLVMPAYRHQVNAAMDSLAHGEQVVSAEEQALRLDGKTVDVSVTRIAFIYRGGPAIQIVARDISERKRLEKQLVEQAKHDALTGLPNRILLNERLKEAISYAQRYTQAVWVIFIDLDRFKFINDSLGHSAGDLLLKHIAGRLIAATRESDTVARLGGDEFVLVLPDRACDRIPLNMIRRLMDSLLEPISIEGRELTLTCSMGVAMFPADSETPEALIEKADIAMYRAKQQGRNNCQLFTAAMQEELQDRVRIENALRTALERDEFFLHYQPQVDATSHRIVGIETLLRWQHPELGIVMPDRFISLAEETGLIVPIGAWVLRTACMQCRAWQDAGLPEVRLAVNLSPRQFAQPDFVTSVAAVLEESGLAAHCLELEITESLVMADVSAAIDKLKVLQALGVQLSIDDFGTGYSSLSYLKRFPINELKIDRTFVRDIAGDPDDAAIVLAIISLAHNLNLRVIAEGVETIEQIVYLRTHGCDELQGYYFSRPLPAVECEKLLKHNNSLGK